MGTDNIDAEAATRKGAVVVSAPGGNSVAAAALDAFDPEPPGPAHPLFELDNVIVTPHLAASTTEASGPGAERQRGRSLIFLVLARHAKG